MPDSFQEDIFRHGFVILHESLKQTAIPAKLIQCYLATLYQADIDTDKMTLRIGKHCESLSHLLSTKAVQCALYITACNPRSQPRPQQINELANHRLYSYLFRYTDNIFIGRSLDPAEKWPAEPSFLALGIDLGTAKILGRHFDQNALVWINNDAIPRLVLLR